MLFCPSLCPPSTTALHSQLPPQPSRPSGKAAPLPRKTWTAPLPLNLPPDQATNPICNTSASSPCNDNTATSPKCSHVSIPPHPRTSLLSDPSFPRSPLLDPLDPQVSQVGPPSPAAAEKPPYKSEQEGKRLALMYQLRRPLISVPRSLPSLCYHCVSATFPFHCGLVLYVHHNWWFVEFCHQYSSLPSCVSLLSLTYSAA